MRNLPRDLTDQSLQGQLNPLLAQTLNITDWICQKPRGKPYGTITFLRKPDGERFLRQHSEINVPGLTRNGHPRSRSRLIILGISVYCTQSKNIPDPFLLRSMAKTIEDKKHQDQEGPETHKATIFGLRELSCGHYEFPLGHLTYVPDKEWASQEIANSTIKFAKHLMIVTFDYATFGRLRLEMPYRMINEIVISARPPSLTLTLWESPRIFHENNEESNDDLATLIRNIAIANSPNQTAQRSRLHAIPHCHGGHGDILGQALVYSFAVSPSDFHHKIHQLKEKKLLTLASYNLPNLPHGYRRMDIVANLQTFNDMLQHSTPLIPFDVKFQFQALVQNGFLLPQTVQQLLHHLNSDMTLKSGVSPKQGISCPISAGAIKKLLSQIRFPGPGTDASEFSPKELWTYIAANEKEIRQGLVSELSSERAQQNLVMVYKVQVTPTRILLQGPEPEAKNRILRKFPTRTQYFARVQFCEEDGQDLFFNSRVTLEKTWSR